MGLSGVPDEIELHVSHLFDNIVLGGMLKGPSLFLSHFSTPSLIFPKIASQINYLHSIPYFRVTFLSDTMLRIVVEWIND